jgi:hypothetical protein
MRLLTAGAMSLTPGYSYAGSQDRYTVSRLPTQVERIAPAEAIRKAAARLFIDFGQVSLPGWN